MKNLSSKGSDLLGNQHLLKWREKTLMKRPLSELLFFNNAACKSTSLVACSKNTIGITQSSHVTKGTPRHPVPIPSPSFSLVRGKFGEYNRLIQNTFFFLQHHAQKKVKFCKVAMPSCATFKSRCVASHPAARRIPKACAGCPASYGESIGRIQFSRRRNAAGLNI
ncbi:MAG: hypothetical protein EPN79_06635 [Burkholderiaceae bacterium]|nr:MAG: hypothetical protein EPN79_06635 [Burkholderiaceae bacterium]TBR74354.1 MAG: hypothetical protein EPN64_15460 [Burkholderiaceae bacterium]